MRTWWVTNLLHTPGGTVVLVSWLVWVVGSIVLHELGHGWAALACGDDTPKATGHMTWNPLVHMGWPSLIVLALLGIAWGVMPVNPANFRGRFDDAIVALAGPMMNVALALACMVLFAVWVGAAGGFWFGVSAPESLYDNVRTFLLIGAKLNIALAIFNLLPVPPLDGSRIAASIVPGARELLSTGVGQVAALLVLVGLFMYGGGLLFSVAGRAAGAGIDASVRVLVPSARSTGP